MYARTCDGNDENGGALSRLQFCVSSFDHDIDPELQLLVGRDDPAPVEVGRLVHLEERGAAALFAPELEHEGADLLRGVGKLELGNVLRHGLHTRSRAALDAEARPMPERVGPVRYEVAASPWSSTTRLCASVTQMRRASASGIAAVITRSADGPRPVPWNDPAAIRSPSSPVTHNQ